MLFDIDKVSYKGKDALGLRLEDSKNYPKKSFLASANGCKLKKKTPYMK